jgi:FMN-dependent NADH-azoreductase
MKKILHIISSPRQSSSVSRKLGTEIVKKITEKYPESVLTERDLTKNLFPHLEESHINSFFTPAENRTAEQEEVIRHSDETIAELQDADIIVIDSPMYNFSIPSTLKAYIDHVARAGHTFRYTENGPEGLLKNKKLYIAFSGGAVYSEGVYKAYDFNIPYMKAVFGFLGITDITVFRAEGLNIPALKDEAFQKAVESIAVA